MHVQHGLRMLEDAERKLALKAPELLVQKTRYARRGAKDDHDRSGRKLWLEYRRLAKPRRKEPHHTRLNTSTIDVQACSTQQAQGERCPVLQYLTPLADTQVQHEFDNWINELKQQAICKRSAKSAARLRIQSTGKLPQTWSYKQYWQHMRWCSQEPRIVAYLYGPQEHIKCITNDICSAELLLLNSELRLQRKIDQRSLCTRVKNTPNVLKTWSALSG